MRIEEGAPVRFPFSLNVVVVALALGSGCAKDVSPAPVASAGTLAVAPPPPPPAPAVHDTWPTHVACVGDSITFGRHASSSAASYPSVLQALMGPRTVVGNFGHSGATALGMGAGNLPYEAQAEYAAATSFVAGAGPNARVAVVLLLGVNDSKPVNWRHSGQRERFRADYAKLIAHFASQPTHPTVYVASPLATTQRNEALSEEIGPIVRELAASCGLPLIDLRTFSTGHPELLFDGVHPNDMGYAKLAEAVRDGLAREPPRPQGPVASACPVSF